MMRLLLATRNIHKARELGLLLEDLPLRIATLDEFPGIPEIEEDGNTLEENASKKALHAAKASGLWCLADDTGLEVEALDGAPGVRSARYAGPGCDYAENNKKLLEELKGLPAKKRGAAFRSVMALAHPEGRVLLEEGRVEGRILDRPRGRRGFGYDPLFYLPGLGKTLAELTLEEKNSVSHRALALRGMRSRLELLAHDSGDAKAAAGAPTKELAPCPRCGMGLEEWHCRKICQSCGFQVDCTDP